MQAHQVIEYVSHCSRGIVQSDVRVTWKWTCAMMPLVKGCLFTATPTYGLSSTPRFYARWLFVALQYSTLNFEELFYLSVSLLITTNFSVILQLVSYREFVFLLYSFYSLPRLRRFFHSFIGLSKLFYSL